MLREGAFSSPESLLTTLSWTVFLCDVVSEDGRFPRIPVLDSREGALPVAPEGQTGPCGGVVQTHRKEAKTNKEGIAGHNLSAEQLFLIFPTFISNLIKS